MAEGPREPGSPLTGNPFEARPRPDMPGAVEMPAPKVEDLGEAVPLGEDDGGFVIEEEDRESSSKNESSGPVGGK